MVLHQHIDDQTVRTLIRAGTVRIAGNQKLKIYGMLGCTSGKRMRRSHRVFFTTEEEAIGHGYRPCGHCMNDQYKRWMGAVFR